MEEYDEKIRKLKEELYKSILELRQNQVLIKLKIVLEIVCNNNLSANYYLYYFTPIISY